MADLWDNLCNGLFDLLLGRLLGFSWTAALIVVAVGTGAILALVRRLTTDQDLLRRAAEDKKRLKQLIREARADGRRADVRRLKQTRAMIATKTIGQELLPLLASILPIAMLATWCYNRLGYHPPAAGEEVRVVFYPPVSAVGQIMHLVPADGLTADRWVQPITLADYHGQPTGQAEWALRAEPTDPPHRLVFRLRDKTYDRAELLVGRATYAPTQISDGPELITEIKLREARLFNIVPGWGPWLPPWLIAYLILVIPLAVVLKRLLRVH
jgi:uncharacterized membrane protein (DUF106 family)